VDIMPEALPRFGSAASVDLTTALAIRDSLEKAKLCLLLDGRQEAERLQHCLMRVDPDYVALDLRHSEAARLLPIIRSAQAHLVLFGAALDYDEDPMWMADQLQSIMCEWKPMAIVLTLLPGLKTPVRWLRSEAGMNEEDVVPSDIEQLLARFPIFINMEVAATDVVWICERFSAARGFAFLAGEDRDDGGCPVFTDSTLLAGLFGQTS
ncbi:MAG: hypothetical protein OEY14_17075, partial [Myxococcales bacterium]|nr:hypothetical protein [Myxococcales bacterium]